MVSIENRIQEKREEEKRIVSLMIGLYCRKKHGTGKELCEECHHLNQYARERSEKCPFMEKKTFCSNCKVHCYQEEMRRQIKQVMRFSGPRMMLYHPILAIKHLAESRKEKKRIELDREESL